MPVSAVCVSVPALFRSKTKRLLCFGIQSKYTAHYQAKKQEAFYPMIHPIVKFAVLPAAGLVGGAAFLIAPGRYTQDMQAPFKDRIYAILQARCSRKR